MREYADAMQTAGLGYDIVPPSLNKSVFSGLAVTTHPPTTSKEPVTLTPSLRASMRDGVAHASMLGVGENYLGVYGIFLRASDVQIGILASLPPFIGAITQLFAVAILGFLRSRRAMLVAGAFSNALLWIPIALLATVMPLHSNAPALLITLVILYQMSAAFTGPPWNGIIGDLIPARSRGAFFGLRNRYIGIATFIAFLAGGHLLHLFESFHEEATGFLVIFLLACLLRLLSTFYLSKHEDPRHEKDPTAYFSLWQFLRRAPRSNFAKFVMFVSAMNGATYLSAPFVTVYLLRDLHLSYLEFTAFGAATAIVQFFTMQYWGLLADRFGTKKILNVSTIGVCGNIFLWTLSSNMLWLLFCQSLGAFVWAGFNLAVSNFLFDAVTPQKRARCAAYQALVTGSAVFVGSLIGGTIAPHLPTHFDIGLGNFSVVSPLLSLFVLSGFFRIAAAMLLLPSFREVREVTPIPHSHLLLHVVGARPLMGFSLEIVAGFQSHANRVKRFLSRRTQ